MLRPACSLARISIRAFCTKGFGRFIASTPASAATGWSDSCRVGLDFSPTGGAHLSTAHFDGLLRRQPQHGQWDIVMTISHGVDEAVHDQIGW